MFGVAAEHGPGGTLILLVRRRCQAMSKRNFAECAVWSMVAIAVCGFSHPLARGADSSPIAASMATFSNPDGTGYFALTLKPTVSPAAAATREVVVLFNTSAGQTGDYRVKGIEALTRLLATLPTTDRVQLMAVDLNATALTKNFVAPASKEMTDAVVALTARTPLGATDMESALTTVAGIFPSDVKNPRAVVYIGDGRSAANLLGTDKFEKLVQKLADLRIPVNSYVVGARVDRQLPGALAVQTGGTVIFDAEALPAAEAGVQLAAAANATVLWPTATTWPAEMTAVFPKRTPPLRGDRETVMIGTLKGKGPLQRADDRPGRRRAGKIGIHRAGEHSRRQQPLFGPAGRASPGRWRPHLAAVGRRESGRGSPDGRREHPRTCASWRSRRWRQGTSATPTSLWARFSAAIPTIPKPWR